MPTELSSLSGSSYLKMLGYGDSESGKTRLIATMVKVFHPSRIYLMNFDMQSNLASITTAANKHPELNGALNIQFDQFSDYDSLVKKIVELKRVNPFDMICLDGGGTLQRVGKGHVMQLSNKTEMTLPMWDVLHEKIRSRIKELISLDCHFYMTFHGQIEKDEIQGKVLGRLNLQGKAFPEEVPCYFNMFLRFTSQPVPGQPPKRVVETAPGNIWPAGERFEALDPIEVPDFSVWWAKIAKTNSSLAKPREGIRDAKNPV